MQTVWRCGRLTLRCWNLKHANKAAAASDRLQPRRFSIVLIQFFLVKSSQAAFGYAASGYGVALMGDVCVCDIHCIGPAVVTECYYHCEHCTADKAMVQGLFLCRCRITFVFSPGATSMHLGHTHSAMLLSVMASHYALTSSSVNPIFSDFSTTPP